MKKYLLVKKIIGSMWLGGSIACAVFFDLGAAIIGSLLAGFIVMVVSDEVGYYMYDMYWPEMKERIKEEEQPDVVIPTTRLLREE